MSPRIALITDAEHPELPVDDRLLFAPLRAAGVEPVIARWNDPAVDWRAFASLWLRAPWDYYLQGDAFLRWLDAREAEGALLLNDFATVRDNLDKRYLRTLEQRGVPIVPTAWIEQGQQQELGALLDRHGWSEAVLKPAYSAGGWRTFRFGRADAAAQQANLALVLSGSTAMVQPFLHEVLEHGEWSVHLCEGVPTHAVVKRAATGNFLVQAEHGGTTEAVPLTGELTSCALTALRASGHTPLHARADFVRVGGRLLLGELELVEPSLYLDFDPTAAATFAAAAARQTLQAGGKR